MPSRPLSSASQGFPPAGARAARARVSETSRWIKDKGLGWVTTFVCWIMFLVMTLPEDLNYADLGKASMTVGAGSGLTKMIWLTILGLSLMVIGLRWRVVRQVLREVNPFLLLFIALAIASMAWSIDRSITLMRVFRLMCMVFAAVALVVTDWHPARFQRLFRTMFLGFLVASIVFGLLRPDLAIHQELSYELVGCWRGLTNHKNGFGNIAVIGLVFWMHGLVSRRVGLLSGLFGVVVCLVCVQLSRSSTSIAMSGVVILVSLMFLKLPSRLQRRVPAMVWVLSMLVLVYALALLHIVPGTSILFSPVTMLTGKNLTFTGRSDIWDIVLEHIHLRPLLGSGYGAYWTAGPEPGTESYEVYVRLLSFYPTQAHNGYLDVLNDLGFVGLATLIAYLVQHIRQSLALYRFRPAQSVLYLLLFFQQALANFTESHFFSVRSLDFVIMTFATFALARESLEIALERRHRRQAQVPQAGPVRPRF